MPAPRKTPLTSGSHFKTALLNWFRKNARPLPWRKHYRPYEVWVSEIMLQQTQMDTVLPYYRRWMKTLPTLASLARAPEQKALKLWQGLGYYSRARSLHANARLIQEKMGGVFPSDYQTLLSLKGIGRYTAGAIASIAFNQPRPIVDGNVLRVLSRLYALKDPVDEPKSVERYWQLAQRLLPRRGARYFNQALMELGALVCAPQNPACALCPVRRFCAAFKNQNQESFPVRRKRKKIVKVLASALVLKKGDRYFLQRRPVGEIMGGLWEFPEWKLAQNKPMALSRVRSLTARLGGRDLGAALLMGRYLGTLRRHYTHYAETLHVFEARTEGVLGARSRKGWPSVWVQKEDFLCYPFSAAHAKIAKFIA